MKFALSYDKNWDEWFSVDEESFIDVLDKLETENKSVYMVVLESVVDIIRINKLPYWYRKGNNYKWVEYHD